MPPLYGARVCACCYRNIGFVGGLWGLNDLGRRIAAFINDLGRRIADESGDPRSAAFLKQRLALAIQRGNAAVVLRTFTPTLAD